MEYKSSLDIPSNTNMGSTDSKENKEKLTPVVSGAKVAKKSLGSRLQETFIATSGGDLKNYLVSEVLFPAVKDTIVELVKSGIEMLFYGDARHSSRPSNRGISPASKVSYQKYYDDGKRAVRNALTDRFSYDDICFSDRADAQDVLDSMSDIIEQFGKVSVADMYDLAGVDEGNSSFQDNKWGWKNLSTATVIRDGKNGFYIKLPKVVAL